MFTTCRVVESLEEHQQFLRVHLVPVTRFIEFDVTSDKYWSWNLVPQSVTMRRISNHNDLWDAVFLCVDLEFRQTNALQQEILSFSTDGLTTSEAPSFDFAQSNRLPSTLLPITWIKPWNQTASPRWSGLKSHFVYSVAFEHSTNTYVLAWASISSIRMY